MRNPILILTSLLLLSCVPVTISAQSAEEELDQVELMKQFAGTWEAEIAEDTILVVSLTPVGGAYEYKREIKTMGVTIHTSAGIYGFSSDKKSVIFAGIYGDGVMSFDYGRFVSAKKFVAEAYNDTWQHPVAIEENIIQSPESFTTRSKWRGEEMKWDVEWSPITTLTKVE